jgi:methyltransferase (TIGR00027 family)
MHEREPSRTALAAATHRAAHQVLERGNVFADPLAVSILGQSEQRIGDDARAQPARAGMRFFIAARSAIAEAALEAAVTEWDVSQLVVLGAGLDTFAYRNPHPDHLAVFEVDHPATQAWKQRRLGEAGIAIPASTVHVAVDFERDSLLQRLTAAGFDPARRSFFTWLGVVPYLTREAVFATVKLIGGLPGGATVAFDYSDPPSTLDPEALAAQRRRAARVAAMGEPFLCSFEPPDLHAALAGFGLTDIDDLGPREIVARFSDVVRIPRSTDRGGHVVVAATP